ncbi:hypothetical protein CH375_02985 [Leptospira ellisii]|uniref:Uncharacterized protein n=1 Tax=Leptospira ellisii TaxID=2023197 RepID=A0A2N0B7Y0_9LEPT|nr:hypothetical protein CH379_11975 [Leptospira ellisii]PKA05822.1 hypothetical protein CH375_02985 [Leptospira ellisii]
MERRGFSRLSYDQKRRRDFLRRLFARNPQNGTQRSCPATVKENTATMLDLQMLDCPVTKQRAAYDIPDSKLRF